MSYHQSINVLGRKTRFRTWDAANNKWNYTTAGISLASNKRIEAAVELPTYIKSRKASTGKRWERVGWFPHEMMDLAVEEI